jgi:hypothetical protein
MEERRKDDSRIEVLTERVENWMETTTDYRIALCKKLDRLNEKVNGLQCIARIEETKGIKVQLKALWVLVSAGLLGIIAEWVRIR